MSHTYARVHGCFTVSIRVSEDWSGNADILITETAPVGRGREVGVILNAERLVMGDVPEQLLMSSPFRQCEWCWAVSLASSTYWKMKAKKIAYDAFEGIL